LAKLRHDEWPASRMRLEMTETCHCIVLRHLR
jgi:hypothetical protein